MKVLLLSAYDAASHSYWRQGLVSEFSEFDWTVLTLPARYFSWRLRGNSLSWAYEQREILQREYDLIIATSMTDLSALRGLVPQLTQIPTLVYFHENQFDYPASGKEYGGQNHVEPKILNLYTALAGDYVVFNSEYNRQTFLEGVTGLLRKLPDHVPAGVVDDLKEKSSVLRVPLADNLFNSSVLHNEDASPEPLHILWNHRWEFDKGPDLLLQALRELRKTTSDFVIHLVGQQFRKAPSAFESIREEFADQLGSFGFVESIEEYHRLLERSDVVLSTALHDFQGIAVLEAVAKGCIPLVPNRLAYPEFFEQAFLYGGKGVDEKTELVNKLSHLIERKKGDVSALPKPPNVTHLSWREQKPSYQQAFSKTKALFAKR